MTHKLILKVKTFQLSSAKRFGTVEENLQGGAFHPPPPPDIYHLGLSYDHTMQFIGYDSIQAH